MNFHKKIKSTLAKLLAVGICLPSLTAAIVHDRPKGIIYSIHLKDWETFKRSRPKVLFDNNNNPLFDRPNGIVKGRYQFIVNESDYQGVQLFPFILDKKKIDTGQLSKLDFFTTGINKNVKNYIIWDKHLDHFLILYHSFPPGVWIPKSQLKGYFDESSIIKYMASWETSSIKGYNKYRLRSRPHPTGRIITKLNQKYHIIRRFTGKIKESWAQVEVWKLKKAVKGCFSNRDILNAKILEKYIGWIKVVKDNGFPSDITIQEKCSKRQL